jgi:Mg-chelatase subunit ChlD
VSPELGALDESALEAMLDEDPDTALTLLAEMTSATDVALRALARRLASQIVVDLARERSPDARGIGQFVTRRYRNPGDDIDLDRSIDALTGADLGRGGVRLDELSSRAWATRSTAWCLLVDRSGSMHGRPLATAALAAAATAIRAARGDYAVLSFARDVVAPKAMWEQRSVEEVVDRTLALRGHGTTDVARALAAAAGQLATSSATRRVTVLLSDCRATEPGDVVAAASALDHLVILAPAGDDVEATGLADATGARIARYSGPSSVVTALSSVFDRG